MSDNETSTRLDRLREIIGQFAQRALNADENHSLVESRRAEAEEIAAALTAVQEEREMLEADSRRLDKLERLWWTVTPMPVPRDEAFDTIRATIDAIPDDAAAIGEPAAEQDTRKGNEDATR